MKGTTLALLFAPIRICAWGREPQPDWIDTGRDTGFREGNPPDVAITAPENGAQVLAGAAFEMQALVEDWDDWNGGIQAEWRLEGELLCAFTPLGSDWTSSCAALAPVVPGEFVLTVVARDSMGNLGESSVRIDVVGGEPPDVVITTPTPDSTWPADAPVPLIATVTDPDGAAGLSVVWIIDDVRRNDLGAIVAVGGIAASAVYLEAGEHHAVAEVRDAGETVTDEVTFTVAEPPQTR